MNNQLEKLVKTLKTLGTIDNVDFSYQSEKYHDHYYLNIKMVRKHSNNEAMMIFEEDIANMRLKIIIDNHKLYEAYKLLDEENKIPKQFNIINPCVEEGYMNSLVELYYLEIINNLKVFNGVSDNYDAIAKLAGKCYGYHFGKIVGI
ncbi:hypothetical protein [Flavobacterium aciduliphilum]|uniref:Uncharacterized protein n=1 Tax=Flavobacterium aciduliphilum TaxID=1101402 RepID=A0A328YT93_9FLAO|nr:hypothetical protein [Flavobacterium aciduliphilum]RAR73757.1 hypothetical protein CLV55_10376 [Flavobacterium aciduliphilum]